MSVPATRQSAQPIFARMGARFGLDAEKVSGILKATAFKGQYDKNTGRVAEVSDEQMAALLVVAEQFNLNPFVREIYAFPDSKGRGIIPVVPIDGWTRISNEHPQYDGVEFEYSEQSVKKDGKELPAWIEAIVFRKDRSRPTRIREYLEECYRGTDPWRSHPTRMLRHKAFIQCCRVAFSFAGIYDEDEGARMAEARVLDMQRSIPATIDVSSDSPAPLPLADAFERLLLDCGFANQKAQIEEYVHFCAGHFNSSPEQVKEEMLRRPDELKKTFPAWIKSLNAKKTKTASPSPPVPPVEPYPPFDEDTGEVADANSGPPPGHLFCPKEKGYVEPLRCVPCGKRNKCPSRAAKSDNPEPDPAKDQAQLPTPPADPAGKDIDCPIYGERYNTADECTRCRHKDSDCPYWHEPLDVA